MNKPGISTPGVYINEVNAFANPVVPVATAVPAFIGYTPQALYEGKSFTNMPQKISSFPDFQTIYCFPDPPLPADPSKQYSPQYYLVPQNNPANKDDMFINNTFYAIVPDPNTIYYLYNSVRLFYENGGGDAYIVSMGPYGAPSGTPVNPGDQIVNPNVKLNDLMGGLTLLLNEEEPTIYICPEATLLSLSDNATLMQAMLAQCVTMQTTIAIFDIIGGPNPDPLLYPNDIAAFRENTGSEGLSYGVAYYPFVGTTVMQSQEIDYTNLFGGDTTQLAPLINPADNPDPTVAAILADIQNPAGTHLTVSQYNNALVTASRLYGQIIEAILADVNVLPPSGGMAGVMATTDQNSGVWQAPANTGIVGAISLPIKLTDDQQANLNVDAVTGKSINAIRFFNGIGILVWGARTLDGNSDDWRYVPVRRTMIMIEQSCKLAAQAYVFQPNDKNTWEAVKATISSFLTGIWQQGGLMGASPAEAFSVACGLGTTMTAYDLLNGFMNVTVQVAVVRPAEFIVVTFQQQMGVVGKGPFTSARARLSQMQAGKGDSGNLSPNLCRGTSRIYALGQFGRRA